MLGHSPKMPEIKPATIKMITSGLLKFFKNSKMPERFFFFASSFLP
jgi:hypothetical protein